MSLKKYTTTNVAQKISNRVQALRPSGIREFFDIVASREDCISLGVGEPDFVSPQPILNAAIESLREGYTHYTGNQGNLSLRMAIANYLKQEYDLSYDAESEILITVGVSQGVDLALRSIINHGDKVLYYTPSYVSYAPMIELAGGEPVVVATSLATNFSLNYDLLEKYKNNNIKAIMLNYPANPTGSSLEENDLLEISRFANENDILIISDEIYAELSYEKKHIPIATLPNMKERTLLLGGFSKSFAMTGFRIAYACGPKEWVSALTKIHQYAMLCAPTISQIAAEAALKQSLTERDDMIKAYKVRRDVIVAGMNDIGLPCLSPRGAFYVFPDISSTGLSSLEFARRLLDEQNVAVVPGTAFGPGGENHIRCSYATSLQEINLALERIKKFLDTIL